MPYGRRSLPHGPTQCSSSTVRHMAYGEHTAVLVLEHQAIISLASTSPSFATQHIPCPTAVRRAARPHHTGTLQGTIFLCSTSLQQETECPVFHRTALRFLAQPCSLGRVSHRQHRSHGFLDVWKRLSVESAASSLIPTDRGASPWPHQSQSKAAGFPGWGKSAACGVWMRVTRCRLCSALLGDAERERGGSELHPLARKEARDGAIGCQRTRSAHR